MRSGTQPKQRYRKRGSSGRKGARPLIAFFDYPDVFEDFYRHYGIGQCEFATGWAAAGGNHRFLSVLQCTVGDVVWYCLSLKPELKEATQNVGGYRIRFVRSSWVHRTLWRAFFMPKMSWRWQRFYPAFAVAASYLAPLSMPLLRALLRDKPDFIVTQDYSSEKFDILVAIARVLGVPVVARHAGSSPDLYLARFIKRWTIPFGEQSAFEP